MEAEPIGEVSNQTRRLVAAQPHDSGARTATYPLELLGGSGAEGFPVPESAFRVTSQLKEVMQATTTPRLLRGAGRHPQLVALLARLGVDRAHEGQGLGAALLKDVLVRLVELSGDIGCRGLLVHAESVEARAFYLHLLPAFEPSPTDGMHLVLLMKDIRRTLRP
jgi:GNAT superfamily N-acetyltransferase